MRVQGIERPMWETEPEELVGPRGASPARGRRGGGDRRTQTPPGGIGKPWSKMALKFDDKVCSLHPKVWEDVD